MDRKERYLVSTIDGQTFTMVDTTFGKILQTFGEDNVWQMIRLDYDEEAMQE